MTLRTALLRDQIFRACHLVAVLDALNGYYVIPGHEPAIAQHGAGDMSVDVPAFKYVFGGTFGEKTTTTNTAVDTSDVTNPRIDLLYVATGGTISILKGTARAKKPSAETDWEKYEEPYPADFSATTGLLLAEIEVPAGATAITDDNIRRICVPVAF